MSDYDHEIKPTALSHVEGAVHKVADALRKFNNDEISMKELQEIVHEAIPKGEDIGIADDEETGCVKLNTKPIPENADSIVYFYEEDGVPKMTVRLPNKTDNYVCTKEERTEGCESLGVEVLRLIQQEHLEIVKKVVMTRQVISMMEDAVGDDDDPPEDENKAEEEDEEYLRLLDTKTRAALKKYRN